MAKTKKGAANLGLKVTGVVLGFVALMFVMGLLLAKEGRIPDVIVILIMIMIGGIYFGLMWPYLKNN